ncbi:TolC family protein [Pedobacter sp. UBA5917]|jgi:cobalt-zinc-cadmium efflux system outer membrane protein|uniref:TolC family protein n=1 Tax=Pedobacter sp. UBA5917 TaxID=1947061 RepID=UPI0026000888|nr:TolC family protein [Pedobacter sp. UBA5917]
MKFQYILSCFCLFSLIQAKAQTNNSFNQPKMSIKQYLNLVGRENIGYAAQKFEVNIAEAGIESAKVFPDPEFSAGVFDNQQAKLKLGQGITFGLSTTLELGGKRAARIALAKSETELNKALLLDYLRNLRADAASAYYDAIQQDYLLQLQLQSYQTMKHIADADSVRFKLGSISETDARQSRLEANNLQNGLFQNEADWKNARLIMSTFAGKKNPDTLISPAGKFENLDRSLNFQQLIDEAQNNRADAIAALNTKTMADKNLALVKANRITDLGVNAGLQFNGVSANEEAPTPYHKTVNVGISFPLKFSNRYKGDLKAAHFTIRQAELKHEGILQQIRSEVSQAYFNYFAAQKQVKQYQNGLLSEGKKILDAKIYSYKRGETSLLEVLNAQRTYNDTQQAFYQSQSNYAKALVELERAAGIWDIE